jgi:hypothetical protein
VQNTNPALAAERRNVYRHVTEKNFLAPEERNVLFGYQMFRSYGARKFVWIVVVYKHLIPLGPKTTAIRDTDWFVTRTLEAAH